MYNQSDVKDIFESFTPTKEKKEELLNAILIKSALKKSGGLSPFRQLRPAFVIAVLLVALTTITALAVSFGWNERLIEFLHPSEKQMQELEGAISTPLAAVSRKGVTIQIKQTIADRQGVYLLYDMTVPEWIELTDHTVFDYRSLNVPGGSSQKIIEQSKHKRTAIMYVSVDGKELPQNLKLNFEDLGYYDDSYQFNLLIEGCWDLEFELNNIDVTKKIEVNQKVDMNGTNNNIVTNIYVSPISILINIEGDDLWTAFLPIVTFKNGEEMKIEAVNDFNTSYSFRNLPEKATLNDDGSVRLYGVYSISRRFDQIIDISEIESVSIGDLTIPVS